MSTIITPKENEKIYFTIRKNPAKLAKPLFRVILLFVLALFGFFSFSNQIIFYVSFIILSFSLIYGFYYLLIWFYDVYIVTNQRVIVVNQKGLFAKEYAEVEVDKIQDVTYEVRGVFATLMRYGTVRIKGEHTTLELADLSDPDEAQEMIKKIADDARGKTSKKQALSAQDLIDYIAKNKK